MKIYYISTDSGYWRNLNYTSTDKSLLEEIICDAFMQDVAEEFYIASQGTFHTLSYYAKLVWNVILIYYLNNVKICESDLI